MPKTGVVNSKNPQKTSKAKVKPTKPKLDIKIKPRYVLPNVWQLSKKCLWVIWKYRWALSGIVLIYGVVNFVIVQGFNSGFNVSSLKSQLDSIFHGQYYQITSGLTIYALMLTSFGSASASSSGGGFGLQLFFGVMASLAIIWAVRNALNGARFRIRDAYYNGMYPLIQFVIVLIIIGVQLLPMVAGISIYALAVNNNIAITGLEKSGFIIAMLALSSLTLYWISSSAFALYIVTLPNMSPIKAMRSAKKLVKGRRWAVLLRMLYLPLMLLIISSVIMVPAIILVSALAQWLFLILSLVLLVVFHSYLYNLYRELLE